ncbi:MAG TPA: GNAT family N-acetyltransferase [Candidatus Dormibacteraeota bacterium]|nr:GNAT family N-acetyltransferase [Candidatus Dormibacteraeota bacterium]
MAPTLAIRPPSAGDVAALAVLSGQLGYPVGPDELAERLAAVDHNRDAAVLVAADGANRPVGWVHVELKRTLVAPLSAQIMGLVVDEGVRSAGIGRELLRAAEAWAFAQGCRLMLVGTRVTRQRAHRFYEREGYAVAKTSHFFEKELA